MTTTASSNNIAVNLEGRTALYIEGVRCPYSEVQLITEDGMIPRIVFSIPPTPSMRDLPRRARIHFIMRELVKDDWAVLFEGEVMSRGFRKTPASRDLTFMGYHVAGHLDQYAISALDPTAKTQAQMQAAPEFRTASLASVKGTILDLMNITTIAAETGKDPASLTFPDFIQGAFDVYKKIIDNSRISDTYPNQAVNFHRLFNRIRPPDATLFDWDEFYSKLLTTVMNYGVQTVGGRVTFWEFLRHMSQFFLHQVSVVPNAEHWTKQIQIRPNTFFHPVPKCNVIFSSMSEEYAYEENYETKPTRLEAHFLPIQTAPGQNLGALARFTTVFAPSELQDRWRRINKALDAGGTDVSGVSSVGADGKTNITAPADGIKFLTREEEQRGLISAYYDIPLTLQIAIMALVEHPAGSQEQSPMRNVDPAKTIEHGQKVLKGTSEQDRIEKYRAFLCMALGDGGGIRPARFGTKPPFEDYRQPGQLLHIMTGTTDARFASVTKIVPRRITVVPLDLTPHYIDNTKKAGFKHPDNKNLFVASGVNYFVDANGNVLQVLPRRAHTFTQPSAVPYGIMVNGLTDDAAAEINASMLSLNQTRQQAKDTPFFVGTVDHTSFTEDPDLGTHVPHWPPELAANGFGPALYDSNGLTNEFYFDARVGAGDPTLKGESFFGAADFGKIQKNRTTLTASNYTGAFDYLGARDQKATVVDVRAVQIAGNDAIYYVKLNKPIIHREAKVRVLVQTPSSDGKQVAPNKPWIVIPPSARGSMKAGPKTPVSSRSLQAITAKSSISNPDQLSGGNPYNFAIGVQTSNGQLTDKCKAGLAWLLAIAEELTAQTVGTLKAKKNSQAERGVNLTQVFEIADYYHAASGFRRLAGGTLDQVKGRAGVIAAALYRDFNTYDQELVAGAVQSLSGLVIDDVQGAGNYSTIPGDISNDVDTGAGSAAATASATGAAAPFTEAVQVQLDMKFLDQIIDNYVGAITNFEFYNMRYAAQSFTSKLTFNPYATAGYPCLILDSSDAKYHLMGFLHSMVQVFSGDGAAYSSATYTHLRGARFEKLIPYKAPRDQYFLFRDTQPYDTTPAYLDAYHERLKALDPPAFIESARPTSFLPWELLDYQTKNAPPFVYSGGFGLDKQRNRDFTNYAAYLGYVDGAGVATSQDADNNFIYAEDPILNFQIDALSQAENQGFQAAASTEGTGLSGAAAQLQNVDNRRALELIYRKIQRVDQLDVAKSQASLVAFVHGDSRQYEVATDTIDVYSQTPDIDADGFVVRKINADGTIDKTIKWQADIQARVFDHLDLIRKNAAING